MATQALCTVPSFLRVVLASLQVYVFLKHFFKGKWTVENVKPYYDLLIIPTQELGRHLFWSNFSIPKIEHKNISNFITADTKKDIELMKKWIGINYEGNIYIDGNHSPGQVLRNCVHPEVGKYILDRAMDIHNSEKIQQQTLWGY